MKALKIILLVIGIAALAIFGLLVYSGLFAPVEFELKETGPYKLVYVEHRGDYAKVKAPMDELYYTLKDELGIETTRGFGLYYDDPAKTATEALRSEVGSILDEKDYDRIPEIEEFYKVKDYPRKERVVTEHPFTTPLSIMLGIFKVYPAGEQYGIDNNLEGLHIMEIYDMPNKKIIYETTLKQSND